MNLNDAHASIELLYGSAPAALSNCLRSFILAAPGHDLIAADFSAIESRVLAWLAGEEWKLQVYRDYDAGIGPEFYLILASEITGIPLAELNKESVERQSHGKVPDLALGFGGGVSAFHNMAKNYNVFLADAVVDAIKKGYRQKHPATVKYWQLLNDAVIEAVREPGSITHARTVRYRKVGSQLFCQLPSGRNICYPYAKLGKQVWIEKPKVETIDGEAVVSSIKQTVPLSDLRREIRHGWKQSGEPFDALQYYGKDSVTTKWGMRFGYGGLYSENNTQAVARDALVGAMRRHEDAGYPIVMHVHDEDVAEVPEGFGSLREYEQLAEKSDAWLTGCPVVAKGWRGKRYRKD